ncbi:hypothetical protein GCM10017788_29650 [Amycolatopsis acidiphila]|nr:hypothetical protein GCM10017788_29650 [Amycolatopsis acidiphila]
MAAKRVKACWKARPPGRMAGVAGAGPRVDRMERMSANAKKIVIVAVVALVLFFLITRPTQSADVVHNVLGWLRDGAEAIVTFVRALFS